MHMTYRVGIGHVHRPFTDYPTWRPSTQEEREIGGGGELGRRRGAMALEVRMPRIDAPEMLHLMALVRAGLSGVAGAI